MSKRKERMKRSTIVFLTVVTLQSLLFALLAGPAAAAEAGKGSVENGTWSDTTMPASNPNCGGKVTSTDAEWTQSGTFTRSGGATTATVVTRVILRSNGAYYFDPIGTHNSNSCSDAPGQPVPTHDVDISTVQTLQGGAVTCNNLSGTFNRNNVSVVTVNASGSCTMAGTSGTFSVSMSWTLNVAGVPDPLGVGLPPNQIVGGTYSES